MPITSIATILLTALASFETAFSMPQVRNFRQLLFGIILCLEGRNISDINQTTYRGKDQSSLNRFVTESPWKRERLYQARRDLLLKRMTEEKPDRVYLIVDDTTCRKFGKEMEGVGYHFSDTDKAIKLGHNIVSSMVVITRKGETVYQTPLDHALYWKKEDCEKKEDFQSKIALATKIVSEFQAPTGTRPIFLADTWYASATLLQTAIGSKMDYIVPIKSNRVVFLDEKKTKLSKLAKQKAGWLRIKVKKEIYFVKAFTVFIKEVGTVRLLVSKRQRYGTCFKAFITNLLGWSASKILNAYAVRWAIERFYEDAKVHLGLDQYQMRKAEGILKYWEIVFVAYQFLEEANRTRKRSQHLKTIGEKCLWIRHIFTQSLLDWIFEKRDSLSPDAWHRLRNQICL